MADFCKSCGKDVHPYYEAGFDVWFCCGNRADNRNFYDYFYDEDHPQEVPLFFQELIKRAKEAEVRGTC